MSVQTGGLYHIPKGSQIDEIRCGQCNKKLAEAIYTEISIKCPRCGTFNRLSAKSAVQERHLSVERQSNENGLAQQTKS